ncbi:hypothetical protein K458DRAFT_7929 [Lentithecium fluviatile CBS 122367]|uniref:Uncharacterized protein n=1 Tax=Lentithecium fluviatile CBS 122367 TaxID=1168545 RepID=A0A6G1JNX2_9PLEO|nr:hypothetical protein K458DRAFT_7929 [Lentithecium fluviatile CBS 122367]
MAVQMAGRSARRVHSAAGRARRSTGMVGVSAPRWSQLGRASGCALAVWLLSPCGRLGVDGTQGRSGSKRQCRKQRARRVVFARGSIGAQRTRRDGERLLVVGQ